MIGLIVTLVILFVVLVLSSIRQIKEYERGIKFTKGKFTGIVNPGWHIIWPIFQSLTKVDVRVKVIDVPKQVTLTKDNVSIGINAVIYYSIFDAKKAVLSVERFDYATSQLAQTTMRNIVGSVTLDELLTDREKISSDMCKIVDTATDEWGIKVQNIELKDITLPTEMQRVLAKVAEAEREKTAVITKSNGEVEASENLARAAERLSSVPGALHLRTLSTINDVSSDQSNTIIFALPLEVLRAFDGGMVSNIAQAVKPMPKKEITVKASSKPKQK